MKELLNASIINIDKPTGSTSREVVTRVKEILKCKKTGHSGTLDPKATGVLVVALNEATKLMPILMGLNKEYEGVMYLHKDISLKILKKTISENFLGEIMQKPPVKSRVARRPRKRKVYNFEISRKDKQNVFFATKVQAGTYIRKLVSDIGEKLSVGTHLKELRRTKVGHFSIEDSKTLEEVENAYRTWMEGDEKHLKKILIPIEEAVPHVKRVYVKDSALSRIYNGAPILASGVLEVKGDIEPGETIAVFSSGKKLVALGVARKSRGEILRTRKGSVVKVDRVFSLSIP